MRRLNEDKTLGLRRIGQAERKALKFMLQFFICIAFFGLIICGLGGRSACARAADSCGDSLATVHLTASSLYPIISASSPRNITYALLNIPLTFISYGPASRISHDPDNM
jgi:hypothetical protein